MKRALSSSWIKSKSRKMKTAAISSSNQDKEGELRKKEIVLRRKMEGAET